jgi:hypothetical protein
MNGQPQAAASLLPGKDHDFSLNRKMSWLECHPGPFVEETKANIFYFL